MLFAILGEECNFSLKLQAFRDVQIQHTSFLECFIDTPLENLNAIQIQQQALHRIAKCDETILVKATPHRVQDETVVLFALLGEERNVSLKLQTTRDFQMEHKNLVELSNDAQLQNFNAIQVQQEAVHNSDETMTT